MAISTTAIPGAPTEVSVIGPMTIYEAVETKRDLLQSLAAGPALAMDLSNVDEVDTAGLQLLLLVRREGAKEGKPVRVVAQSAALAEVLDRYGLASCFDDPPLPPR